MKHFVALLLVMAIGVTVVFAGQVGHAVGQPAIYYIDRQGNLAKEHRQITAGHNVYVALAQAVAQPPQSQHLSTAVPEGTSVRDAWFDQGIVYVDYTKELFSYGGGTFREQRLLAQIVYTLTQVTGVRGVQILVEGHKVLAPEGSPTDGPLTRGDLPLLVKEEKVWPEKE